MLYKRKIILGLIIIFSFCITLPSSTGEDENIFIASNESRGLSSSLKTSPVIEPIHIDDNWTETVSIYDWCSGNGLYTDPYIIKDLKINAYGFRTGMLIENTAEYFRIQNCTIYNSGIEDHTDFDPEFFLSSVGSERNFLSFLSK